MIIALEEAKYKLENFREDIVELGSALRIDELRAKVAAMEETTSSPEFWNDQANSGKVLKEIKHLKDKIDKYEALDAKLSDDEFKEYKDENGLKYESDTTVESHRLARQLVRVLDKILESEEKINEETENRFAPTIVTYNETYIKELVKVEELEEE